ncbi:MAG: hypothetical protein ACRC1K_07865, partial [Planctomycetia bacterium]
MAPPPDESSTAAKRRSSVRRVASPTVRPAFRRPPSSVGSPLLGYFFGMTALVAGAVGLLSATFPTSWTCALAPVEFVATDRLPSLASLLPSAIPSIEPPRSTASAAPRPPTVPSSGSVGNRNGYVRLAAAGSDDARPGAVSKLEPVDYLPPLRPTTPRGSTAAAVVLSVEPLVLQVAGPSLPVMVEPPPP